jgi:hypothetical protein
VIGLTAGGELTEGYSDQLFQHELNDQEKWELSRFMIERWMEFRDTLWTEHEHEHVMESLGKLLNHDDVRERVEAETENLRDEMMGEEMRVWEMGDPKGYMTCPLCNGETNTATTLYRDTPPIKSNMSWINEWRCIHCKGWHSFTKDVETGSLLTEMIDKQRALKRTKPITKMDGPFEKGHGLEEMSVAASPFLNCRCLVVPVEEEIADGPKCPDTTCFEHDSDYKDGCSLKSSERDKCGNWQALVSEKEEMEMIIESQLRGSKVKGKVIESAQDYTCPVPECFYKVDEACTYKSPSQCGIKQNYINGLEVDLNYKGLRKLFEETVLPIWDGLYYSGEEAHAELTREHSCPECSSQTCVGMVSTLRGYKLVEPRYCPLCDWKESLCNDSECHLHRESPSIKGHCVKGIDGRNCHIRSKP